MAAVMTLWALRREAGAMPPIRISPCGNGSEDWESAMLTLFPRYPTKEGLNYYRERKGHVSSDWKAAAWMYQQRRARVRARPQGEVKVRLNVAIIVEPVKSGMAEAGVPPKLDDR